MFLWESFSLSNILNTLTLFFDSFGHYDNVAVLRPFGIANILSILSVLLIFISLFSLIGNCKKLPDKLRLYTIFIAFDFIITCMFIAFTLSTAPITYWIPIIPLFIPLWGLTYKYDSNIVKKKLGKYSALLIIITICLTSLCTYLKPNDSKIVYAKDYSVFKGATAFLCESGYSQGFAPFWLSNLVTEMTGGQMEMWTVEDISNPDVSNNENILSWLQIKSHKEILPQNDFVIITYSNEYASQNDMPGSEVFKKLASQDNNLVYSDEYARIYAFKSLDEFKKLYKDL